MTSAQLYPELYLAIFDRLDRVSRNRTDLRNVSMASRLFHELAEPLIFTEILLQMDRSQSGIEPQTRAIIHHLTSRAKTREWVKSVKIIAYWNGDKAIDRIADIFVELHNLRNIIFETINLTDGMVRHLLCLSHPFRLNCWNVGYAAKAEDLVLDTRGLQITELVSNYLRGPNMILLITRLTLGPHLSVLSMGKRDSPHIYPIVLQNPGHNFDIRRLEVYLPVEQVDMMSLLSLLASCPRLSHLKIISVHVPNWWDNPTFLLPTTSIPDLSSFEAPYDLAGLIVWRRPVLSLRLLCDFKGNLDRELLSQLAEGSASLRELDVDGFIWRDDVLLNIAEYFPALQTLRLRVLGKHGFSWMVKRLTSGVQRLPPLQRFVIYCFTPSKDEVEVDYNTLKSLKGANNRLVHIGLCLKTEWSEGERRWVFLPLSRI